MSRISEFAQVGLKDSGIENLIKITNAHTEEARKVQRAKILLLVNEGKSIGFIADKLDLNRKSVELCIDKFLQGKHDK